MMLSLKNKYFLLFIFLCSCLDRFEIPENIQDSDSEMFGAGDTTYLLIQPTWNSEPRNCKTSRNFYCPGW